MEHNNRYMDYREMLEEGLKYYLPQGDVAQKRIFDAMYYSLLSGGKRIRGTLLLEFCRVCGGNVKNALPFACAVEMIHTYSLVHDDLPCMDNDDMRRGQPTNHKVFGEYMAVLSGDGLLNAAFETALDMDYIGDVPPETVIKAAHKLARAAGAYGMIGGQVLDMDSEGLTLPAEAIALIHDLKTGALINVCAEIGCLIAGAAPEKIAAAVKYTQYLGLAFQIRDDILDVSGDPERTGKATGRDVKKEKSTFAGIMGIRESEKTVGILTDKALAELSVFEDNEFLVWLTRLLSDREF